jgi:putative DNA primase/helicase
MREDGLFFQPSGNGNLEWICGPFTVMGQARDVSNGRWSIGLEWSDPDGISHSELIPKAELLGDGIDGLRPLADGGLALPTMSTKLKNLKIALASVKCSARVRMVSKTGWHGSTFVLPTGTIGSAPEPVRFQGQGIVARYGVSGSLVEWRDAVAQPCAGNSRLLLAQSIAFAGPIFDLLEEEPGGIHFVGPSSSGKSTALLVAGSVWGGGARNGFAQTWRATGNGLEGVAKAHSGTVLILDELGELDAREAGGVAYALMNGQGKARADRSGEARARAEWRCMILSSGEMRMEDKIEEAGRHAKQGQLVRFVDLTADAGRGMGIFEATNGEEPARFAERLRSSASGLYGAAGLAFLENVADAIPETREMVRDRAAAFMDICGVSGDDGQISRVGRRFALIGAAGELARLALELPWDEGEAERAALACLSAWRAARGGDGAGEIRAARDAILQAIEQHGESRFIRLDSEGLKIDDRSIARDVLGYRFDHDGEPIWGFTSTGWKQVLRGVADPTMLARELANSGLLVTTPSEENRHQLAKKIGGVRARLYAVRASSLNEAEAT